MKRLFKESNLMVSGIVVVAIVLISLICAAANANAGESYYFSEGLFFKSKVISDARKDNIFDDELLRRGMSTSTVIFQNQPTTRYGVNFGKGYRAGKLLFESSIFIDPASEVKFKNEEFGESHMRIDTVGALFLGGISVWRIDAKVGGHITNQQVDVHNWGKNIKGELAYEEHLEINDWSGGMAAGLTLNFTDYLAGSCLYLKDIGDVDKTGTQNHKACGLRLFAPITL